VTRGRRLRVLVVHPYPEPGGAGTWLLRLLDAAADRLEPEAVLLDDGPMRGELEQRGIPVEVRRVGRRPIEVAPAALWLARRLRRRTPDVVLGNILKAQLVAAPAGRLAGVPTVWAKHDHGYDRWLAVPLGRLSTKVIGAVEELAEPTRRADAVIIPPPRPERPPASRAHAREHLRAAGVPLGEAPVLVMAGRLVPFKGVDDAVRALALPPAVGWRLVAVGSDDHAAPGETERLRAVAAEAGVAERVHLAGHVDEVSHWLAGFDALAVLTKPGFKGAPDREGFGTSAFEAMVAGIPVVAVEGGAVVRRLEGRAGIGVPPGSPEAVADALGRLSDPEARRAAGEAARSLVADHPDLERCAELLVEVLEAAAARRRGQRRRSSSSS
jgi:glycosyltransferase involved in cell wall biosynthesis